MCIASFHNPHTYQLVSQNAWHTKNYSDCALRYAEVDVYYEHKEQRHDEHIEKKNRVSQTWDTMDSRHIFTSKHIPESVTAALRKVQNWHKSGILLLHKEKVGPLFLSSARWSKFVKSFYFFF